MTGWKERAGGQRAAREWECMLEDIIKYRMLAPPTPLVNGILKNDDFKWARSQHTETMMELGSDKAIYLFQIM